MIGVIVPVSVALAFICAIVSVWLSKPINKGILFHDTGYDEKHPPTSQEWRTTQVGYTALLAFLGTLFTLLAWLCVMRG